MKGVLAALLPWLIAGLAVVTGGAIVTYDYLATKRSATVQEAQSAGEQWTIVRCPITLPTDLGRRERAWEIYRFGSQDSLGRIVAYADAQAGGDIGIKNVCAIEFSNARQVPGGSVDWRIGYPLFLPPGGGASIVVTFLIKADRPAETPTGTVYLYDGTTVDGVPVYTLDMNWSRFIIKKPYPRNGGKIEIWYRLIFGPGGRIKPSEGKIYFTVEVANS